MNWAFGMITCLSWLASPQRPLRPFILFVLILQLICEYIKRPVIGVVDEALRRAKFCLDAAGIRGDQAFMVRLGLDYSCQASLFEIFKRNDGYCDVCNLLIIFVKPFTAHIVFGPGKVRLVSLVGVCEAPVFL